MTEDRYKYDHVIIYQSMLQYFYLITVVLELDAGPVAELLPTLLANLYKLLYDAALALAGVLHDDVRVLPARRVQDVGLLPAGRQAQLVQVNQPRVEW